jgi:hypothetical protein
LGVDLTKVIPYLNPFIVITKIYRYSLVHVAQSLCLRSSFHLRVLRLLLDDILVVWSRQSVEEKKEIQKGRRGNIWLTRLGKAVSKWSDKLLQSAHQLIQLILDEETKTRSFVANERRSRVEVLFSTSYDVDTY